MRRFRVLVACAGLVLALLAVSSATFGASAGAQTTARNDRDRIISVSGDVDVERGQVVDGPVATMEGDVRVRGTVTAYVLVGDGDAFISGRVKRSVVVAHGDAHVSGTVGGDVVALTGRVFITDEGHVRGDVVSRLTPRVADGTVDGEVRGIDLESIATGVIIGFLAYLWLAVTIAIAVLGFVFVGLLPRAADTAEHAGHRVAASIGWGALIGIVGPLVAVLVLVTVVGLPLGITMIAGLNVLAPLGYVTVSLLLGRLFVKGPSNRARIGAFFAGFGILRLVALIPGIGLLVWIFACVYGIGAVSMAAWYGGRRETLRDSSANSAEFSNESAQTDGEPELVTAPAGAEGVDEPITWSHEGEEPEQPPS